MKSEAKKYLHIGIIVFILMVAVGVLLIWVFDNVFSGTVVDFLNTLVSGVNATTNDVRFNGERLAVTGFIFCLCFSAILVGTGTLCAYNAYRKQHALLEKARLDAEKAQAMAQIEAQRKSDLITYLAHDLKTPLASVIAYLSLLDESPDLPPEQRAKYTGIALDKAYRLEQLIGELFEIIRFNLHTISLEEKQINLKLMLLQLADEFYPLLLPQGKHVKVLCEDGLTLRGDSDKLARVFNNILKNAAVYSDENTTIYVEATQTTQHVVITFTNTGDPIPAQKQKLIFEKFYRLDASRSSRTGGAGLGLAIAKEIVEAHGGTITVSSDEHETKFVVTIPRA